MDGFGEKDGFDLWIDMVKEKAAKHDRVFAFWSEEMPHRRDEDYNDGLEVADLSGWLLTPDEAERFEKELAQKYSFDFDTVEPSPDFVHVSWAMDGSEPKIIFELWKDPVHIPLPW